MKHECSELLFSLFAASADTHTKSNYKSVKVKSEFKDVTSLQTVSQKICISHTVSNPSTSKGCHTTDVDTTFSIGGDCYIHEFQSNSNVLYLIICGNKSKCFVSFISLL